MATHESIGIETRDGLCPATVVVPDGAGPFPAVILYMDAPGVRPALFEIADALAGHGYLVLVPNLFYRLPPPDPAMRAAIFTDAEQRRQYVRTYLPSASLPNVASDTDAFVATLVARPDVIADRLFATGYCMGGGHALTALARHPERIRAASSFHGGHLATDDPHSPHRLAPAMRGEVYVAAADEDPIFPPEMKARLEAAFAEAGTRATVVTYEGARHGFAPSDTPAYHPEAAARHLQAMVELFGRHRGDVGPSP